MNTDKKVPDNEITKFKKDVQNKINVFYFLSNRHSKSIYWKTPMVVIKNNNR